MYKFIEMSSMFSVFIQLTNIHKKRQCRAKYFFLKKPIYAYFQVIKFLHFQKKM